MKARIKATGEIINIADSATVTLDVCNEFGNPIEKKFDEVEILQDEESSNPINWEARKWEFYMRLAIKNTDKDFHYLFHVADMAVRAYKDKIEYSKEKFEESIQRAERLIHRFTENERIENKERENSAQTLGDIANDNQNWDGVEEDTDFFRRDVQFIYKKDYGSKRFNDWGLGEI